MKTITYKTSGTCSRAINLTLDDNNVILSAEFIGGCNGNTKGIAQLVKGMKAEDVIERLKGTHCGPRATSCPDQLANALQQALEK